MLPKWCVTFCKVVLDIELFVSYNEGVQRDNPSERNDDMDFGENLKKAREEKGLTQQHLADKLYVTRQAVSRWEGGSRYPDLITTKCIANILGVSIDSLVSNDEMKEFAEKQSITNNQKDEKIITTLYAIASLLSVTKLIQSIISISLHLRDNTISLDNQVIIMLLAPILLYVVVGILSIVAFYKSLKNDITPKVAGAIGMIFYGYYALSNIAIIAFNKPIWQLVVLVFVCVIFILIIRAYFFERKSKLSTVVCIGCVLSALYIVATPVYQIIALVNYNYINSAELTNLTNVIEMFIGLAFVGILLAQTIVLEKKRKLCGAVK